MDKLGGVGGVYSAGGVSHHYFNYQEVKIMSCTRTKIIAQAQEWIGLNEADGSHKKIIDIYNSYTPRARGYKVQYTDAWCATFVSAVAIACNATDIIPTECSCNQMIALFKKLGIWVESDAHKPKPGDIIFYDWQDSGSGDNKGSSDHVGFVEAVVGDSVTVAEGNFKNAVGRRLIKVNGKYIRGYGVPEYDADAVKPNDTPTESPEEDEKPQEDEIDIEGMCRIGKWIVKLIRWLFAKMKT